MTCTEAKNLISITDYLIAQGMKPVNIGPKCNLFHSPFRQDREPSFAVYDRSGTWYDWGTKESGDLINLVERLKNLTTKQVIAHIKEIAGNLSNLNPESFVLIKQNKTETLLTDYTFSPIQHPALIKYLKGRGISETAWRNCEPLCQVNYQKSRDGRKVQFFNIGFKNDRGGFEVRGINNSFKNCISPKGITTVYGTGSDQLNVNIFEGWSDYLSALTYYMTSRFRNDCIILNSVALLSKAMAVLGTYRSGTINCFLDNDEAGFKAFCKIKSQYPQAINQSERLYSGYKDFNEFISRPQQNTH